MVIKIRPRPRPRETICGCQSCTIALIVTGGVRVDDVAAVSDDAFASGHVANPHRSLCGRHSCHAVTKHVRYSAGCYALHPGCFLTLRNAPRMRVGAPRWLESRTPKSLANTTSTQPQGTDASICAVSPTRDQKERADKRQTRFSVPALPKGRIARGSHGHTKNSKVHANIFSGQRDQNVFVIVNHVGRLTLADSLLPLVTPLPTAAALEGLAGGVIKASSGSFRPASPIPASHSPALPFLLFLDAWEAEAGGMCCVEPSIIMLLPGQRRPAACATISSPRYWTIIITLRDQTPCTMGWTQVLGIFQQMTGGEIATRKEAARRAGKGGRAGGMFSFSGDHSVGGGIIVALLSPPSLLTIHTSSPSFCSRA